MELRIESVEERFRAFLSSQGGRPDHFMLHISRWNIRGTGTAAGGTPPHHAPSPLVDFLGGPFHGRFMRAVRDEGFREISTFARVRDRYDVCILLSRTLDGPAGSALAPKAFGSLYAAGAFRTGPDDWVACWDGTDSLEFPHFSLCSKEGVVDKGAIDSDGADLQERGELRKALRDIQNTASTLKVTRGGFHGKRLESSPEAAPDSRSSISPSFGAKHLRQHASIAMPYAFVKVTDEDVDGGGKGPERHKKKANATRREKKRQYHRRLRARKKAEAGQATSRQSANDIFHDLSAGSDRWLDRYSFLLAAEWSEAKQGNQYIQYVREYFIAVAEAISFAVQLCFLLGLPMLGAYHLGIYLKAILDAYVVGGLPGHF